LHFCHAASLIFMEKGQIKNHRLLRRYIQAEIYFYMV
jgi:hypothetical protein